MTDITVRSMKEKDISQAANIHRKVIREGLGQGTDYKIEDLFRSFIQKSPNTCFIAEQKNAVVGFIIGEIKEWGFGVERSGWIEMVEVDPKHMGKGVGKALGAALIQYYKNKGINEVFTSVRWDSSDLIEFFKSIGFDKSSFINLVKKSG